MTPKSPETRLFINDEVSRCLAMLAFDCILNAVSSSLEKLAKLSRLSVQSQIGQYATFTRRHKKTWILLLMWLRRHFLDGVI